MFKHENGMSARRGMFSENLSAAGLREQFAAIYHHVPGDKSATTIYRDLYNNNTTVYHGDRLLKRFIRRQYVLIRTELHFTA